MMRHSRGALPTRHSLRAQAESSHADDPSFSTRARLIPTAAASVLSAYASPAGHTWARPKPLLDQGTEQESPMESQERRATTFSGCDDRHESGDRSCASVYFPGYRTSRLRFSDMSNRVPGGRLIGRESDMRTERTKATVR